MRQHLTNWKKCNKFKKGNSCSANRNWSTLINLFPILIEGLLMLHATLSKSEKSKYNSIGFDLKVN